MKHDPYFTTARYDGQCPETGKPIIAGDEIVYYPRTRRAYHHESKAAADVRALKFAECWEMADANY